MKSTPVDFFIHNWHIKSWMGQFTSMLKMEQQFGGTGNILWLLCLDLFKRDLAAKEKTRIRDYVLKSCQKFVRKLPKTCQKIARKFLESCQNVTRMLPESHEKVIRMSWESHEKVMRQLWDNHEPVMRQSWDSHETVMRHSTTLLSSNYACSHATFQNLEVTIKKEAPWPWICL